MENVDWAMLARAYDFYKSKGYEYVETRWLQSVETVSITAPTQNHIIRTNLNDLALIGSAEQAFIAMDLPRGRYFSISPCFRVEREDALHQTQFVKLELFQNYHEDWLRLLLDANTFFSQYATIQTVQTPEGFDLEVNEVEIGSYGKRSHKELHWAYGTGLALPRFNLAKQNIKNLHSAKNHASIKARKD
jgi:elongation factor P--beta-lysine ligase